MSTAPEPDPFDSPEYAAFVESIVPHCHCAQSHRPCDGVLAGGLCDHIKDEREPHALLDDDQDDDALSRPWGDGGLVEL